MSSRVLVLILMPVVFLSTQVCAQTSHSSYLFDQFVASENGAYPVTEDFYWSTFLSHAPDAATAKIESLDQYKVGKQSTLSGYELVVVSSKARTGPYIVGDASIFEKFKEICQASPSDASSVKKRPYSQGGCEALNPATFLSVLITEIGVEKTSLVAAMKTTKSEDVFRVRGYELTFFSPSSSKIGSLKESTAKLDSFRRDARSSRRASNASKLVGVSVSLAVDAAPESVAIRSKKKAHLLELEVDQNGRIIRGDWINVRRVAVRMELELDAQGNWVGGEWLDGTAIQTVMYDPTVPKQKPDVVSPVPPPSQRR
jgi:hypothetical protein